MSREDIASLAFKIMGIYVLVIAVRIALSLPTLLSFDNGGYIGMQVAQVVAGVLGALLLWYAGAYLIKKSQRLARMAFPLNAETSDTDPWESDGISGETPLSADTTAETTDRSETETPCAGDETASLLEETVVASGRKAGLQEVQAVAFAVIGVWLFVGSVPAFLRHMADLCCAFLTEHYPYPISSTVFDLIDPVVEAVIGFFLFFRASDLARFFSWLRTAGRFTFIPPSRGE
jgi:hypothetical protein